MAKSDIILYDLACNKGVCFSPAVWRVRLMLNYKSISYTTVFLEFPDIEPTLKQLGVKPVDSASGSPGKYTVPAIYHAPTEAYIMDSIAIAQFLETTYPSPPVVLASELGREIQTKARGVVGTVFRSSVTPREINILSLRSQEHFRRNQEAALGCRLEDLLDADKEEKTWERAEGNMRALGELLRTNRAEGAFILGARPSFTDFFIAGNLQTAREVDEGVFQRIVKFPGYNDIYEACQPHMERRN